MNRFLLIALCLVSTAASAQIPVGEGMGNGDFNIGSNVPDPENPGEFMPYQPPIEPNIPPVKFIKQDPPASLKEAVERIIYGIKVDVPPEYDVFGYEIRRYMAHIGGPEVFVNDERILEELKNIRKARIILDYWRKDIMAKNAEIQKRIEAENPGSDVRTKFKFNSGLAAAFLSECQAWIDHNEALLKFLHEKQGAYTFTAPNFMFHDSADVSPFAAKYTAAKKAHKIITEYSTFGIMVY